MLIFSNRSCLMLVALAASLLTPATSLAQRWGTAQCQTVVWNPPSYLPAQPAAVAAPVAYRWVPVANSNGQLALYLGSKQIGNWSPAGYYRPLVATAVGESWGEPCEPPVAPPAVYSTQPSAKPPVAAVLDEGKEDDNLPEPDPLNSGIIVDKLAKNGEEKATYNGKEISPAKAYGLVMGSEIPDDADLPRLTVVGDQSFRFRLLTDLESSAELLRLSGKVAVGIYPPTTRGLSERGYSKPGIYFTDKAGKRLWPEPISEYPGPASLADKVEKALTPPVVPPTPGPTPNPEPSPSPEPAPAPVAPSNANLFLLVLLAAACGALAVLRVQQKWKFSQHGK